MKIESELKKEGIEIISVIPAFKIKQIASIISGKICESFPEHNINESDLFTALSKVKMFYANFKDNSAAKYSYKTGNIYFKEDIDFDNLEAPAIHECIHFIQTVKNDFGKLVRLGLYEPSIFGGKGLALNEAAVQLMASDATNTEPDFVKYFELNMVSASPDYYPIECALVKQMTYFTGTYPLYHSAIYSDDIFKNTFIMKSDATTYNKIVENLDLISENQETLRKENLRLSYISYDEKNTNRITNCKNKIEKLKTTIHNLTLQTQEIILSSCAKSDLDYVRDNEGVKEFKEKMYNFKEILIQSEGYTFYNDFYCNMMEELDKKRELIKKYGVLNAFKEIRENFALIETRQESLNLFKVALTKIKETFKINQKEQNTEKSTDTTKE